MSIISHSITHRLLWRIVLTSLTLTSANLAHADHITSGKWLKKSTTTQGSWVLNEENGKVTLKLNHLKTRKGPDLKIFLSPLSPTSVHGKNATRGSLKIAALKSNTGSHSYTLPSGIDLSKYKSVIIHCEKFSKTWAAGAL